MLDLLGRLVDKSLVAAVAGAEGVLRYRMLEPVRQYGRERLEGSEEADAAQRRHATWFLALAEEAEPGLKGPQQGSWLGRLEREHDNFRAALSWALEQGEAELVMRLAGALGEFWQMRGYLSEGRRWMEAALANEDGAPPASVRAKALHWAGWMAWEQNDHGRSMALSEESLALSRELGDKVGTAAALSNLGWEAVFQNELERASTLAEEAIALQRASGEEVGLARSLLILGVAATGQGDYEQMMALHEESLALVRKEEDNFAISLSSQRRRRWRLGHPRRA